MQKKRIRRKFSKASPRNLFETPLLAISVPLRQEWWNSFLQSSLFAQYQETTIRLEWNTKPIAQKFELVLYEELYGEPSVTLNFLDLPVMDTSADWLFQLSDWKDDEDSEEDIEVSAYFDSPPNKDFLGKTRLPRTTAPDTKAIPTIMKNNRNKTSEEKRPILALSPSPGGGKKVQDKEPKRKKAIAIGEKERRVSRKKIPKVPTLEINFKEQHILLIMKHPHWMICYSLSKTHIYNSKMTGN